jgi:hypothetical protein
MGTFPVGAAAACRSFFVGIKIIIESYRQNQIHIFANLPVFEKDRRLWIYAFLKTLPDLVKMTEHAIE